MSAIAVAQKLCAALDLSRGAIRGMKVDAQLAFDSDAIMLRASWETPDTYTGEPTRIFQAESLYVPDMPDETLKAFILARLYEFVRTIYQHEADEAFCVNGVRLHDPHARERGPVDYMALTKQALEGL